MRGHRIDAVVGAVEVVARLVREAEHDLLDLRDLAVLHAQAQRDQRAVELVRLAMVFLDRGRGTVTWPAGTSVTNSRYLPLPFIVFHRPSPISSRWPSSVKRTLGDSGTMRGLVGDNCIEVAVDEPFEAGTIASRLRGGRRGDSSQRQRAGNHCGTKQSRFHLSPFQSSQCGSYQAWSPPSLFRNLPVSLSVTPSITFMSLPTATGVGISPGMFCPWKLSTSTPPG